LCAPLAASHSTRLERSGRSPSRPKGGEPRIAEPTASSRKARSRLDGRGLCNELGLRAATSRAPSAGCGRIRFEKVRRHPVRTLPFGIPELGRSVVVLPPCSAPNLLVSIGQLSARESSS
jgi:hypothetical protein